MAQITASTWYAAAEEAMEAATRRIAGAEAINYAEVDAPRRALMPRLAAARTVGMLRQWLHPASL